MRLLDCLFVRFVVSGLSMLVGGSFPHLGVDVLVMYVIVYFYVYELNHL